MDKKRWDEDENFKGVATGKIFLPDVEKLRDLMQQEGWVAEDPMIHLYPHIIDALDRIKSLQMVRAEEIPHGVFEVKLRWEPSDADAGRLASEVFTIVGSFAEFSTAVTQKFVGDEIHYEITTGMPGENTRFQTHGHLVRLRVTGEAAADAAENYRAFLTTEVEGSPTSSKAPEEDVEERAEPS
jgi:hypothetical protein